jgi:hypothetical protein
MRRLDEVQKQRFELHLQRHFGGGMTCPVCGRHGTMTAIPRLSELPSLGFEDDDDRDAFPLVVMRCSHCAGVVLLSALDAGLMDVSGN